MKVCLILEGCYPYVRGGVSTWVHQYITSSPDIEFVLWTIHASVQDAEQSLYEFPSNVKAHYRVFLNDNVHSRTQLARSTCKTAVAAIHKILYQKMDGWDELMDSLRGNSEGIYAVTRSAEFLELARELSEKTPELGVADAFYGLRSMFLPIAQVLSSSIPEADIYHSAVAGYGGLLASLAAHLTGKPMILTEHGLYPREREEELLSADWTIPSLRTLWTQLFYDMSRCAYLHATKVTALFEDAKKRQITIGCDPRKCTVIPNGIDSKTFSEIPACRATTTFHIGAFVRFASIKDIKTMIYAFAILHRHNFRTQLHLMGGTDDEEYKISCIELIRRLRLEDCILVEGHVDTLLYMEQMNVTLLTSISEGQPLALLESMAAGRPCVATRVGNCEELIEKVSNGIGSAGICCTPMIPKDIASALGRLSQDEMLCRQMGENGRRRVATRYRIEDMLDKYHNLYKEVENGGGNRI